MKSNIKLIFEDETAMTKFSILFFYYLTKHKYWLKNCNFHNRKNNLYIYTHNYCAIDNFINNNHIKYNYKITKL